jgi:predicted permease
VVAGGYFQAMRIPLLAGRLFSDRDAAGAPAVIVVNQPFVQRYFPHQDPIGRRLVVWEGSDRVREIVGIVGGVRDASLQDQPPPAMYVPYDQSPGREMRLTVRAIVAPSGIARPIRAAVTALDPAQAVAAVRTMDDLVSTALAPSRFSSLLVTLFGLAALLLAAVGLYGVISYAVGQRRQELGIRAALGARPADIVLLVVAQGVTSALLGLALGGIVSPLLTRLLRDLLFGLGPYDPTTFAAAAGVILLVALLACLVPARRAAGLDPAVALRHP